MAASKPIIPSSLDKDTAVTRIADKIYEADLSRSYCVGVVPNGGYVASVFLRVASTHLTQRNQPHAISAHWTFLNRTQAGRALFRVVESKLGRGTSVLHISLHQDGLLDRSPWIPQEATPAVAGYITNGNIDTETGVTLPTGWTLEHPPPPVQLEKLAAGSDPYWCALDIPILKKVPMVNNMEHYVRRTGHVLPTTHDMWVRLADGERFSQASLGYLADAGPPLIVESFRPKGPDEPIPEGGFGWKKGFWYPTLSMTLDARRKLPEEGVEWLRLRVVTKEIRNGRYDSEVLMFDTEGNLMASSNHVAMALDIERNYGGREKMKQKI